MTLDPLAVIPQEVAAAVPAERYWFVIGGQAVRCFCPYRPSRDVDFGVVTGTEQELLVDHLRRRGRVELTERAPDTVHLTFDGVDVSIFVLPSLRRHTHNGVLTSLGILATKTHAILDRGLRRDFFDLYVMLEVEHLGLLDCLRALSQVYDTDVNEGLVLRALVYFDDAEREPAIVGEGMDDWQVVKSFFINSVGALLSPPLSKLAVQARSVEVRSSASTPT